MVRPTDSMDRVRIEIRRKRDQARTDCDDIKDRHDADWLAGRISALNETLTLIEEFIRCS